MERLEFENYEDFACEIVDKFDSLYDEYGDISIIARYNEAKEIIRELLFVGFDINSLEIYSNDYHEEYIISIDSDMSVWCEKFKRKNGYINDDSSVVYVMDNCSSAVFKHVDSEETYEVCVGEDDVDRNSNNDEENETEHSYTVNGKSVDKKTFNEYVSKFAPNLVDENNESKDSNYSISVKCNLDADEALELITDMERRIMHMDDMFREMDCFRRLFNW